MVSKPPGNGTFELERSRTLLQVRPECAFRRPGRPLPQFCHRHLIFCAIRLLGPGSALQQAKAGCQTAEHQPVIRIFSRHRAQIFENNIPKRRYTG